MFVLTKGKVYVHLVREKKSPLPPRLTRPVTGSSMKVSFNRSSLLHLLVKAEISSAYRASNPYTRDPTNTHYCPCFPTNLLLALH